MQRAVETTAYFSRGNDKSVLVGETLASAAHSFEWNTTTRIFYQNGPESILERVLGCRSFSCNMKYLKIEIVFKKKETERELFSSFFTYTHVVSESTDVQVSDLLFFHEFIQFGLLYLAVVPESWIRFDIRMGSFMNEYAVLQHLTKRWFNQKGSE